MKRTDQSRITVTRSPEGQMLVRRINLLLIGYYPSLWATVALTDLNLNDRLGIPWHGLGEDGNKCVEADSVT